MNIREIEDHEIGAVAALLHEGFPQHDLGFWHGTLALLASRPRAGNLAKLGFLLEVDGGLQGVILVVSSEVGGSCRSNLSSWYVREEHRKYATFLYQRAIKSKETVYLNLSPSPEALPIAKAFGFKPYTGGTLRLDLRAALGRSDGRVHPMTGEWLARLDADERRSAEAHLGYGCRGFILEDRDGFVPALYRVKQLKRVIPAARFVGGATERLVRASGAVARHLAGRGIAFLLLDAPRDWTARPGVAHFPDRELRYAKNAPAPGAGDLRETEIAVFFPN